MELPEIRLHIGRYLSINDLASCILVNKLWHDTFLPYLYHKCDTDVIYQAEYWPAFKNNLQHTRELNIFHNTLKTSDDRNTILQKCRLLRKLSLNPANLNNRFFLRLIQQNPRLRQVYLSIGEVKEMYGNTPLAFSATSAAATILDTIAQSCPRLTELGVDMMLHPESEKLFYGSFSRHFMPRLTKLHWSWFRLNGMETLPWMTDKYSLTVENRSNAWCTPPDFPELKELIVYICIPEMPYPWEQELLLFQNSPKLEVLSWSWDPTPLFGMIRYNPSRSIDLFIGILCKFIATRWLKLHSISLSINKSSSFVFQDEHVSRVLKSLRNPLRRFELSNGNPCTELTWQALSQHLPTIQVLHINRDTGMELSSSEIEYVLSSGQHLIDFQHDSVLNASDVTKNMTIDKEWPFSSSSHFRYPWACHRLQILKIVLLRHPDDHLLNLTVFAQLAEMKELRVLHISSENRGPEYGLNPGDYLYDLPLVESLPFDGLYDNYNQMGDHPVGKRLLVIWPRLTNCYWYNF